jgi:hypothetical protein
MSLSLGVLIWAAGTCSAGLAASPPGACDEALTHRIPPRPKEAPDGSAFVRQLSGLSDDERENAILEQLLAGNIPQFQRHLTPVHLQETPTDGHAVEITLCVSPDYVAIGTDHSFFLVPMRLRTALTVAHQFRFALPTPRIVDAIYAQAALHLQPQPLPASDTMRTTGYYWQHNELVSEQRASLAAPLGELTAGDKKDLVLTNRLWTNLDRVAIYGWHRPDGSPIQPLSTVHGARYADYSHGVRFVSDTAYLNGHTVPLLALLQNPRMAHVLSTEGQIRNPARLVTTLSNRFTPSVPATKPARIYENPRS